MLDRIDCSPDDDARIDAITSTLRQLHAAYQALQTENERLRMELVAEASAAAEQKLRADQLTQQHRMQAQMHAQATQQLAELEASKNARIHELEMQALDLASENSILKRQDSELEARKPLPPDALADKCEAWLQAGGAANIVDAFEAGYRAAERAEQGKRK